MDTHNKDKQQKEHDSKNNLSEAANKMRTSPDSEERSEAAEKMGHAGGTQSHKSTNQKQE